MLLRIIGQCMDTQLNSQRSFNLLTHTQLGLPHHGLIVDNIANIFRQLKEPVEELIKWVSILDSQFLDVPRIA